MMNFKWKVFYTILIVCLLASSSFAQNYTDLIRLGEPGLGSDARSLGMGNAFTGVADNYSAILANPAGLAQIKKGSLAIGIKNATFMDSAVFRGDIRTSTNNKLTFGQLGIVAPYQVARGSLVFAFGYSSQKSLRKEFEFESFNRGSSMIRDLTNYNDDVPYYLGLSYPVFNNNDDYLYDETPIDGNLTQSGKVDEDGHLYAWSFAFAWEAARNLYLGGTVNYRNGWYRSDRQYYEDDWDNMYDHTVLTDPLDANTADFQTFYLNDILEQNFSGWDAKIGILYNSANFIKVGGTVKFPTRYTVTEHYNLYGESIFGNGTIYAIDPPLINDLKYKVKTPYEFTGAVSVNLFWLLVSGQVTYIDYTSMEFTGGFDSRSIQEKNIAIRDNLTETVNFNLGGEFTLPDLYITGRAGLIYKQSPYKGDSFNYDKKYATLGASIGVETGFQLDVAYAYGWWRDFTDNYGAGESRIDHYIDSHNVMVNAKFNF